jgi:hypothetical protein
LRDPSVGAGVGEGVEMWFLMEPAGDLIMISRICRRPSRHP